MEARNHGFDRERGGSIPASWLKSHGRSLVRYHLRPETKFQGGEFDQRGPLKRRHVFALAQQSIGKEADNIEENEFIGEDAGPPDYGVVQHDRIALATAVFDIQKRYGISDRRLASRWPLRSSIFKNDTASVIADYSKRRRFLISRLAGCATASASATGH